MPKSTVFFQEVKNSKDRVQVKSKFKHLIKESKLCDDFGKGEFVAIKTHMGEKNNAGHVPAEVIKALVDKIKSKAAKPFLTDTNVIYHGQRTNAVDHLMLADEHGFNIANLGCPVIIADGIFGENAQDINIDKKHFKNINVARPVLYLDNIVSVAHATSHILTGFAASIKNIGMGFAARAGKLRQHASIKSQVKEEKCVFCKLCVRHCPVQAIIEKKNRAFIQENVCVGCAECLVACKFDAISVDYGENAKIMVEKMVEYAYGILSKAQRKVFFNFALKITKNCDCLARDEPSIVRDLGIFASSDPVACDKAVADMVLAVAKEDVFKKAYPGADAHINQLTYAQKMGLGSLEYALINVE